MRTSHDLHLENKTYRLKRSLYTDVVLGPVYMEVGDPR